MVEKIIKLVQIQNLQKAFRKVFKSNDPFGAMFQSTVEERLILCPIDGYHLNKKQFRALQNTLIAINENKIYLSEIEVEECFSTEQCNHWEVPRITQYEEYLLTPVILENALYSPNGKWGILISHEEHAVIGGTAEFLSKFKEVYDDWESGIANFQKKWQYNKKHYNADIEWLSKFVAHINRRD
ncbi:hypothetical protein Ga0466249_004391 [Sporomusaceae bacterium BoRhaA]|uniref:hypothetical protein n=1 Tax=Pelorhabdus rhamnosifermentans TaxID=2772457 RepID=UPI001C05F7FA|nr:hypothetical protein [Pelorhabdus rhamnosifermentans]MBU2703251.1 hypothetical protein [Pelorhabdus rhamnosifermentans]